MKTLLYIALAVLALVLLYGGTIRGNIGIPTPHEIEFDLSKAGQAFETSQERSRYALLLSLYNYKTVSIDHYASMGTPDIGQINGHYYSFFPPGASLLAIPLYFLGLLVGAPQIFVFSLSTIFALLTMAIMVIFCRKLKTPWPASIFAAFAFGFATNAWGYSVTFYAHLISAFLIISGIFLVSFLKEKNKLLMLSLVWILYGIAVFIDFPNIFIFLPIVIMAFFEGIKAKVLNKDFLIHIKFRYLLLPIIFLILMAGYAQYNKIHFGNYSTLSNAIPRVKDLKDVKQSVPETEKNVVGALNTRNMLEGFRSFTISRDRGMLIYSPVIFLFVLGIGALAKKDKVEALLLAVPATCLILYTMFGDPYGGWAFGSRYMIAILPALCVLGGIGLHRFSKNVTIKILISIIFAYSASVSLLAPLTTNVIPPFVEARNAGLAYDYSVNIGMLLQNNLNSFVYNNVLNRAIPGVIYYLVLLSIVIGIGLTLIWWKKGKNENSN